MSAREERRRKSKIKRQLNKDEIRQCKEIFSDVTMNGENMKSSPIHNNLPLAFRAYAEALERVQ
ncbi:MAG: hypothetical protein ACW99U_09695 [Candidatus Thorarchaeota archaeon]|jgi:hypothetical protein